MAPMSSFSCSVCDDEFASVSTLHYHQMCLHTTEELSLAILSIRELPVNASPVAGTGGSSGNAASPSTDCEDKLLRNGLAKYPRFLNSGGSRKSKILNSENKHGGTDDTTNTPRNLVSDKENIIQNNAVSKKLGSDSHGKDLVGINVEKNIAVSKDLAEPVRSSLWGAIRTLDGKAVDAPVIKIDKKLSSNQLSKSTLAKTDINDRSEKCLSISSKVVNDCHDSDSPSGKERVLEKHLKLMNMSSFDDCIELECSDDSDDDAEAFTTDASCDEVRKFEIKEEENIPDEDLVTENFSDTKSIDFKESPDEIKASKNKRFRGKIQKQRSWYKGTNFPISSNSQAPKDSDHSLKDLGKSFEENEQLSLESQRPQSDEKEITRTSCAKVFVDTCVQTDNLFFEEFNNSVVKVLPNNQDKSKISPKKITPKKKHVLDSREKNSKDKNTNHESGDLENSLLNEPVQIKSEIVMQDGEKRFYCNDCAKTYKKRSHLERHKRVHTGERPFGCPYCDKGFSVRSILNQHIRIHTGEKPYACTICAARFPQKSGLMTHMMLHTGKPFKCDQCDKAFVSNHKLVHHLKSHDGDRPHVCSHCTSAFFTAAALNDHKTLHSRNRKHICNKCNASFVHEVYLKIHLATHLLEADCENEMGAVDVDSVCPNTSTSPQSNAGQRSELTLTLDAIDQFYNGETIMMDVSV